VSSLGRTLDAVPFGRGPVAHAMGCAKLATVGEVWGATEHQLLSSTSVPPAAQYCRDFSVLSRHARSFIPQHKVGNFARRFDGGPTLYSKLSQPLFSSKQAATLCLSKGGSPESSTPAHTPMCFKRVPSRRKNVKTRCLKPTYAGEAATPDNSKTLHDRAGKGVKNAPVDELPASKVELMPKTGHDDVAPPPHTYLYSIAAFPALATAINAPLATGTIALHFELKVPDLGVAILTAAAALVWVRLFDELARRNVVERVS
jgi:hypothetical protein